MIILEDANLNASLTLSLCSEEFLSQLNYYIYN